MEIRLLRYFLAAAREKNITRASYALHISQPSLSKQLMELEQQLGKKLFIRGKRSISLTEEGLLLYKRAEEIIQLCEKTEQEIARSGDRISGEISIGGGNSDIIAKAAARLVSKYPGIRFSFFNGDAEEVSEKLDRGTLDFGILIEPIDTSKYDHFPLAEINEFGLFMKSDAPLAAKSAIEPKDLRHTPLIIPQRAGLQAALSAWANTPIEKLRIIATFNTIFNNPSLLIKNGLGCAFGVDNLIDTSGGTICFKPFKPAMKIQHGLIWRKHCFFSKASQKFLEEIRSSTAFD